MEEMNNIPQEEIIEVSEKKKLDWMAIIAVACAGISVLFCAWGIIPLLCGAAAIVLSILGKKDEETGKKTLLNTIAFWAGIAGAALSLIAIFFGFIALVVFAIIGLSA